MPTPDPAIHSQVPSIIPTIGTPKTPPVGEKRVHPHFQLPPPISRGVTTPSGITQGKYRGVGVLYKPYARGGELSSSDRSVSNPPFTTFSSKPCFTFICNLIRHIIFHIFVPSSVTSKKKKLTMKNLRKFHLEKSPIAPRKFESIQNGKSKNKIHPQEPPKIRRKKIVSNLPKKQAKILSFKSKKFNVEKIKKN